MTLRQALEDHLAELSRPSVRTSGRTWLPLFGAWCQHQGIHDLAELGLAHLEQFHRDLLWQANSRGRLYSAHSVQVMLVRLRFFLRWAESRGWVAPLLARSLTLRRVQPRPARLLDARQLAALWAAPNRRDPRGLRDALLLELVASTRVPLAECPLLTLAELARWELEPRSQACLEAYLTRARPELAPAGELLFGSRSGPGLSYRCLLQIIDRLGRATRVPERLTPRQLRRSYQALLDRSAASRLPFFV